MSTKHTPGPWKIYPEPRHVDRFKIVHASTGYCIGEAYDVSGSPENEANAHVMAAAPDLLEALKEMTETGGWMPSDERFIRANAAIAKATGTK
jgi:hypothetical protein